MMKIVRCNNIVDAQALDDSLARTNWHPGEYGNREDVLLICKNALMQGRAELKSRLNQGIGGAVIVAGYTFLMDQILCAISQHAASRIFAVPNPTSGTPLVLVATGGYGRAELAPYSDIDLLFLHPWKLTSRNEKVIEYILYMLWDLGLSVGHATRSEADCIARARSNMIVRTSLLEIRYLWGDTKLFQNLKLRFQTEVVEGTGTEFVAAKLLERKKRHQRMGDSRYLLEPNIKDGKGGLRDLHTLYWLARYLYGVEEFTDLLAHGLLAHSEKLVFIRAQNFLCKVRAYLHLAAGRPEDRMTFDLQVEIATQMGYLDRGPTLAVERFMKNYFLMAKAVGDLTRLFCASLEAERLEPPPYRHSGEPPMFRADGFQKESGRIVALEQDIFVKYPLRLIKLFCVAQKSGLDIHPQSLRLVRQSLSLINRKFRENKDANATFLSILTDKREPEVSLRKMSEAGVLGAFIPEFRRIIGQTQFDMYHTYTVDEHTLRAIGTLSQIEQGMLHKEFPLASKIFPKILSRTVLYIAVFTHDFAKGSSIDHCSRGAQLTKRIGSRFGLSLEESEQASWLVRHHLLFTDTAFKRDLYDSQTMSSFVSKVSSIERLRLLLVFTMADIKAVGPGRWNAWKSTLLHQLYCRAEEILTGGHEAIDKSHNVIVAKESLQKILSNWPKDMILNHCYKLDDAYWITFHLAKHKRHAELILNANLEAEPFALDFQLDLERAATEITVYVRDRVGIFASIVGVITSKGANIVEAKAFTNSDGMALDCFWIQNSQGEPFSNKVKLEEIRGLLLKNLRKQNLLQEQTYFDRNILALRHNIEMAPRVLIDNRISSNYTVVEINALDRRGLLYDVSRNLTDLGMVIKSAHISTFGVQAVDVFYIKDYFGMQINKEAEVKRLRSTVYNVLVGSDSITDLKDNLNAAE